MKELIYDEMYFSSVSECNDPYEGKLFAVFEKNPECWNRLIKQALSKKFQEEYSSLVQRLVEYCIEISPISVNDFLKLSCSDFHITVFIDEILPPEQAIETFISPLAKAINDIKYLIVTNALVEHYFVSFSKSRDNILMWSHYANNHKGYCLVFHPIDSKIMKHRLWWETGFSYDTPNSPFFSQLQFNFPEKGFPIHDIEYNDELTTNPNAFLLFPGAVSSGYSTKEIDAAMNSITDAYLRKHSVWRYEEEARLLISGGVQQIARQILHLSKHQRLFHYDPSQLVGIILGVRMPSEQRTQVTEIIKQKLKMYNLSAGFVIFEARLSTTTRNIEVEPIKILYPKDEVDKKHFSFNQRFSAWVDRNK